MKPVRIKYYGLIWLTKSAYLITTLILFLIVVVVLAIVYPTGYLPPFHWPGQPVGKPAAGLGFAGWLYNHFYDVCLFCLFAEVIDIIVTLRNFARKEAQIRTITPGHESTMYQ